MDPAGLVDGGNLYAYVRGNPVRLIDSTGQFTDNPDTEVISTPTKRYAFGPLEIKGDSYDTGLISLRSKIEELRSTKGILQLNGNLFVQNLINDVRNSGMENIGWLENIEGMSYSIELVHQITANEKPLNTVVAGYRVEAENSIIRINISHEVFNTEMGRDDRNVQAIVLHELKHIWQTLTGGINSNERIDISMEVEAFNMQFAFERAMDINSISKFRPHFDRIDRLDSSSQKFFREQLQDTPFANTPGLSTQSWLKELLLWCSGYWNHRGYTNSRGWKGSTNVSEHQQQHLRECKYFSVKKIFRMI